MRIQGDFKQKIKRLLFIFIKNAHNLLLFICRVSHNLYKITKETGFLCVYNQYNSELDFVKIKTS